MLSLLLNILIKRLNLTRGAVARFEPTFRPLAKQCFKHFKHSYTLFSSLCPPPPPVFREWETVAPGAIGTCQTSTRSMDCWGRAHRERRCRAGQVAWTAATMATPSQRANCFRGGPFPSVERAVSFRDSARLDAFRTARTFGLGDHTTG